MNWTLTWVPLSSICQLWKWFGGSKIFYLFLKQQTGSKRPNGGCLDCRYSKQLQTIFMGDAAFSKLIILSVKLPQLWRTVNKIWAKMRTEGQKMTSIMTFFGVVSTVWMGCHSGTTSIHISCSQRYPCKSWCTNLKKARERKNPLLMKMNFPLVWELSVHALKVPTHAGVRLCVSCGRSFLP